MTTEQQKILIDLYDRLGSISSSLSDVVKDDQKKKCYSLAESKEKGEQLTHISDEIAQLYEDMKDKL